MKLFFIFIFIISFLNAYSSKTCKLCHPSIYNEYKNSIHANSSIYKDKIFKTIWQKNPLSKKGDFKCAKCHTPNDSDLINHKSKLSPNSAQLNNPISCQNCHQIKDIHKGKNSNENIYLNKDKYFFSADKNRKGEKISFKHTKSFFGLSESTSGSPYHKIDYSNELYYNGKVCMGCHANKKGTNGFEICSLEVKESKNSKNNCISCHMPNTLGSYVNLKNSKTHKNHNISLRQDSYRTLGKYIDLNLTKTESGFRVTIKNLANHALFVHPMRLGMLKVGIIRDGKTIKLKSKAFHRVIGKDGKPTMPWVANSVIKDTTIKAFEALAIKYKQNLKKGDKVDVDFGYYLVNPKIAKKLNIKEPEATKFRILKSKVFKQ